MSHANAALTPVQRLRIGRLIVEDGWSIAAAAEYFRVSWPTAKRWSDRYRAQLEAGVLLPSSASMADRSSRPQRSPNRTPAPVVRRIVHLRWKKRLGPVQIGGALGMPPSTVHAVLVRCRLNRLTHVDRRTGEVIRRYEHEYPGSLVHVDVKKLGNIPDGGGWRYVGRPQGSRNRSATAGLPRNRHGNPKTGTAFVHSVLDDHSRVVYSEIHNDETGPTAAAVLRRATAWFAGRGIRIERVLSDNLADGWAFARLYRSESARRNALPAWVHHYNHHRLHTAIGNQPPISRLTNVPGQYS